MIVNSEAKGLILENISSPTVQNKEGHIVYDTDDKTPKIDKGNGFFEPIGSGGVGSSSIFALLDAESDPLSDWTVSGGVFAFEEVNHLAGKKSYKFTPSAVSQNVKSKLIDVPKRSRQSGKVNSFRIAFSSNMSGFSGAVIGATTATTLAIFNIDESQTELEVFFNIAEADLQIEIQFECAVYTPTMEIIFDSIEFNDRPYRNVSTGEIVTDTTRPENTYSGLMLVTSGTPTVDGGTPDWMDADPTDSGTGDTTINYAALGLTHIPTVLMNVVRGGGFAHSSLGSISNTSAVFRTFFTNNAPGDLDFTFSITRRLSDYVPVTAPVVVTGQKIANITEQQANGVSGGGFDASSTQNRSLNTISGLGYLDFVTLNPDGSFDVDPGDYKVSFWAIANGAVNGHQAFIYNDTTSSLAIPGASKRCGAADDNNESQGSGTLSLLEQTKFYLKHDATTSNLTDGFGAPASSGNPEVYSGVTLEKLR